jgi:hypothetical protein
VDVEPGDEETVVLKGHRGVRGNRRTARGGGRAEV